MPCRHISQPLHVFLAAMIAGLQIGCGGGGTEPVGPVLQESNEPVVAVPAAVAPERLYTEFQAVAGVSQCEAKSSVPANERLKVLVDRLQSYGIEVMSSSCGNTGLSYPAVCGGASGDLFLVTVKPVLGTTMRTFGFLPTSSSVHAPMVMDCKFVSG